MKYPKTLRAGYTLFGAALAFLACTPFDLHLWWAVVTTGAFAWIVIAAGEEN